MNANRTQLSVTTLEARDCPATLGQAAQALVNQTVAHAQQLVRDVATYEYYRPTVAKQAVINDLNLVNNAANSRNINLIFASAGKLLTTLHAEAQLISRYRLPQASALTYQPVVNDFVRLVQDRYIQQRIILIAQLATQATPRVQVQQQFQIPPISVSKASIAASQRKMTHLDTLIKQQDAIFSKSWVQSFGS